jgi:hypothetical protein
MQKARLALALVLPGLSPALLPPVITVRRLDSTSTSEWCAAAAVRAAAFLDESTDQATLLRKVRLKIYLSLLLDDCSRSSQVHRHFGVCRFLVNEVLSLTPPFLYFPR